MNDNKYYWIRVDGIVHKYIPMYRNMEGDWCYDQLTTRVFISDYKLRLLHGKDCIGREVDFDRDVCDWSDNIQQLEYFTYSNSNQILYGSENIFYYTSGCCWCVNKFEDTRVLKYKGEDL